MTFVVGMNFFPLPTTEGVTVSGSMRVSCRSLSRQNTGNYRHRRKTGNLSTAWKWPCCAARCDMRPALSTGETVPAGVFLTYPLGAQPSPEGPIVRPRCGGRPKSDQPFNASLRLWQRIRPDFPRRMSKHTTRATPTQLPSKAQLGAINRPVCVSHGRFRTGTICTGGMLNLPGGIHRHMIGPLAH